LVGLTVNRDPDGITIYIDGAKVFLDKIEAARLAETVKEARRHYWKRFRLQHLKEQEAP